MLDITSILHVDCSPRGAPSFSRRLGAELMARLAARHPRARIITHDVAFHNLEGMGRGPDVVARALDGARAWLDQRLPPGF